MCVGVLCWVWVCATVVEIAARTTSPTHHVATRLLCCVHCFKSSSEWPHLLVGVAKKVS